MSIEKSIVVSLKALCSIRTPFLPSQRRLSCTYSQNDKMASLHKDIFKSWEKWMLENEKECSETVIS